jgi:very-short-patch-repair endonuclease
MIEELKILLNDGLTMNKISDDLGISISSLKRIMYKNGLKSMSKKIKKQKRIVKSICKECKIEFEYERSNRNRKFCSRNCSLSYNKINLDENRKEINKKISKKLTKIEKIGNCLWCKKEFEKRNKNHKCCSRSCSSSEILSRPEQKNRVSKMFSKLAKERYEKGDNSIGWKTRKKLEPSYPEKITMEYLDIKNIKYERELKFDKYFIDFAFNEKKIALEIDGRRHDDVEISEKDNKKDIILFENGWMVHRIKWKNDNKHYERLDYFISKFEL